MDFATPTLFGFGCVLFRAGGLVLTAPIFSSKTVPTRMRIALACGLALTAFLGAGMPAVQGPQTVTALMASGASETLLGACGGWGAKLALDAALGAGQLAGLSMGFGYGALVDPVNGAESGTMGQLVFTLATAAAIALGLHRELVLWLCASLRETAPGGQIEVRALLSGMVGDALRASALGVRLAFPMMAAALAGNVAMGIAGRFAPQIGLNNLGFSVSILVGGGALFFTASPAAEIAAHLAVNAISAR